MSRTAQNNDRQRSQNGENAMAGNTALQQVVMVDC